MIPNFIGLFISYKVDASQYWNALEECIGVNSEIESVYFSFLEREGVDTYSKIQNNNLYIYGNSIQKNMRMNFIFKQFARAWFDNKIYGFNTPFQEWLNDCASMKIHSPYLTRFNGSYLEYMININSVLDDEKQKKEYYLIQQDTIESRTRFVRAISHVIDFKSIYPFDLADIVNSMARSDYSYQLFDFLNGDLESQKRALSDVDLDGLTDLEESLLKTDPRRWDTDGDGWWDGQQPVQGAVAVRPKGGEVCLGVLPSGNSYRVQSGGQERYRFEQKFNDER